MRLWFLSALFLTGCFDKNGYVYVSLIEDESDSAYEKPAPPSSHYDPSKDFRLPILGLPGQRVEDSSPPSGK